MDTNEDPHDGPVGRADRARLDAFTRALSDAIRPDSVVVEVGSGSLARWARVARDLGAARVVAVEEIAAARAVAREVASADPRAGSRATIEVLSPAEYRREVSHADVLVAEIAGTIGACGGSARALGLEVHRLANPELVVVPGTWSTEIRGYSWSRYAAASPGLSLRSIAALAADSPVDPRVCATGPHVGAGVLTTPGVVESGHVGGTVLDVAGLGTTLTATGHGRWDSFLLSTLVGVGGVPLDALAVPTRWCPVVVPLAAPVDIRPGDSVSVTITPRDDRATSRCDLRIHWRLQRSGMLYGSGVCDLPGLRRDLASPPPRRVLVGAGVS